MVRAVITGVASIGPAARRGLALILTRMICMTLIGSAMLENTPTPDFKPIVLCEINAVWALILIKRGGKKR